jgi:hypothetical protein
VIDECIHGLDVTRCDLCSPKPTPAPGTTATPPRARTRRTPTTRTGAPSGSASPRQAGKPINVGDQRIHHLTHIDNLAGIIAEGLHADASAQWDFRPEIDISSADTREARRGAIVTRAGQGATVADYVPFFLSPNAAIWEGIRARTPDPRISAPARRMPAAEFVMLVSTVKQVADPLPDGSIVVSDGDAADPRTRFTSTREEANLLLRRLHGHDESGALQRAEFLVHDAVPFELFGLIGVANDRVRAAVRAILDSSGHSPRLAVHPPWFATPELA